MFISLVKKELVNFRTRGGECFFRAVKFVRKDLEFLKRNLVDYVLKSLSGETLCKFAQIFPPKDLVYFC